MGFNDIEKKKIENTLKAFLDRRRPPVEIRNKVDINYRIESRAYSYLKYGLYGTILPNSGKPR
jgi:hypothetical protein